MTNPPEITNELTTARSAEALREQIGPNKQYSYEDVAGAIDVDVRTVESWVLGRSLPGLYNWLKLAGIFGGEFVNRYIRLSGLDGAGRHSAVTIDDAEMNGEAAQLVAALSDALRDLRIDHTEKPGVIRIARTTHDMLTDWLHTHDGLTQLMRH